MFHALRAEPQLYISQISPKPFWMVVGLQDSLIDSQKQVAIFKKAGEPKQLLELNRGHFDVYRGENFEKNVSTQVAFLDKFL
jgi:hypothetical protein